jgi:hypothetical protein
MEDVVTHAAPKKGQQPQKLDTNIHTHTQKKRCHLVYTLPNGNCFSTRLSIGSCKTRGKKAKRIIIINGERWK